MQKFEDGYWINIFTHYPLNKLRFERDEQFLHSDNPRLFSRFSDINSKYKIKGKYIFMLQYPVGVVKWEQKNNPLDEEESELRTEVEGFVLYEHPQNVENNTFGGLAKTKREQCGCINTFLKGHFIDERWWYSVGQKPGCCEDWQKNTTPGPFIEVDSIHLWIKVNPHVFNKSCKSSFFGFLYLFILSSLFIFILK